jgi:hypothetical protein
MKKTTLLSLGLAASAFVTTSALADVVYVTARPSPSGAGANQDGTYLELIAGSDTSAASTAVGVPARSGCRFFSSVAFSNTIHTGESAVRLAPTLGVPGGVYQLHHTHSSLANNTTQDAIAAVTASGGCALSFTETDAFQRRYGQPAPQGWRLLGYVTNDPGSSTPMIDFRLQSSTNINSSTARFPVDVFRFTLYEPCLDVAPVSVTGPLATSLAGVQVTGVTNATQITVYQDSGAGMVPIGSMTSGIVNGANTVPVAGLVKGALVAATQTVNGQQGCVPAGGTMVGGGANPSVRLALSIRETPSTGPIGSAGVSTNGNIHFLGASNTIAGAPGGGVVLTPGAGWQTVTFDRQTERVGDSANVQGALVPGSFSSFWGGAEVIIRVYAFRTVPSSGVVIYSQMGAESAMVTSNDVFAINWTWDAVPGAAGYRILRNIGGGGFIEYLDVTGTSLNDAYYNNPWITAGGDLVTPNVAQNGLSIRWNPSLANTNALPGTWGILEAIGLVIEDLTDTGPFDLYIDNVANGDTVFQTFEGAVSGTTDFGFRAPSFSGTTSGNLLLAPNQGAVVNTAADTGTKSFRVQFQWNGTNSSKWLRLTTSGVGNPQVNLDLPISLRVLLLPVGSTPVPPAPPTLSATRDGEAVILNWTGTHRVQSATDAAGPYTTIPGVTVAPYTNLPPLLPQRFFRLMD